MEKRDKRIIGQGPIAVELAKALGVDPKTCVSIDFRMAVGEVVTVTVTRHVYEREAKTFARVLERFNLVPEDDGPQDITSLSDQAVRNAIRGAP